MFRTIYERHDDATYGRGTTISPPRHGGDNDQHIRRNDGKAVTIAPRPEYTADEVAAILHATGAYRFLATEGE